MEGYCNSRPSRNCVYRIRVEHIRVSWYGVLKMVIKFDITHKEESFLVV